MIRRFLERLEEAALGVVQIVFLLVGVTGVAAYFGAPDALTSLEMLLHGDVTVLVPWLTALAFDVFMWGMARNVAKSWRGMQSPVLDAPTRAAHKRGMLAYGIPLIFAVIFNMWNQVNFLLDTWHPTVNTVLPMPPMAQYLIRALAIPLFFMCTAFLAQPPRTVAEEINELAHNVMRKFTGLTDTQTKAQIKQIEKRTDLNMGEAIVAVARAAGEPKTGATIAAVQGAMADLVAGKRAEDVPVVPVTSSKSDAKMRARNVYRKNMHPSVLAERAKINIKTARRYVKEFEEELGRKLRLVG